MQVRRMCASDCPSGGSVLLRRGQPIHRQANARRELRAYTQAKGPGSAPVFSNQGPQTESLTSQTKGPRSKPAFSTPRVPNRNAGLQHKRSRIEAQLSHNVEGQTSEHQDHGIRITTLAFHTKYPGWKHRIFKPRAPDHNPDLSHQQALAGTKLFHVKGPGSKPFFSTPRVRKESRTSQT